MLDCDACGTEIWTLMSPRDLLALVPEENRAEVRQSIRHMGPSAVAFVCPTCERCGITT